MQAGGFRSSILLSGAAPRRLSAVSEGVACDTSLMSAATARAAPTARGARRSASRRRGIGATSRAAASAATPTRGRVAAPNAAAGSGRRSPARKSNQRRRTTRREASSRSSLISDTWTRNGSPMNTTFGAAATTIRAQLGQFNRPRCPVARSTRSVCALQVRELRTKPIRGALGFARPPTREHHGESRTRPPIHKWPTADRCR